VFAWKIWLRWFIAAALYYSGALFLLRRIKTAGYPVILNYHRVLDGAAARKQAVPPGMYVRPRTFEKQLRYLARRYRVVTMEELLAERKSINDAARPLCAITFDDGWRDNYEQALPLLRKHRMPATLFVSTNFIGSDHTPWFYRLGHILHTLSEASDDAGDKLLSSGLDLPPALRRWLATSSAERQRSADAVIEALKDLPAPELESIVGRLQKALIVQHSSSNGNGAATLDWRQLREMASSSIEIGSHGLTHMILTQMPLQEAKTELQESKRCIEEHVEVRVGGFSYPNGNHSPELETLVRNSGYRYACTTRPGPVDPGDSPYALKRIRVHDDVTFSTALFACHIAGVFKLV